MQISTIERMRSRRLRDSDINAPTTKKDKKSRRNRRVKRAIKEGNFQESNTLDKERIFYEY